MRFTRYLLFPSSVFPPYHKNKFCRFKNLCTFAYLFGRVLHEDKNCLSRNYHDVLLHVYAEPEGYVL